MVDFENISKFHIKEKKETEKEEGFEMLYETYHGSELMETLSVQRERNEKTTALFTDIDNTFYKAGKENAMAYLTEKAKEGNVPIIAVTGNDFNGVHKRIESGELPHFQVIAGSVGTEIWVLHKSEDGKYEYKKDEYFEKLLTEGGFEREELVKKSLDLIKELSVKSPESRFDFQIPEIESAWLADKTAKCQSFKISFYFFADRQSLEQISKMAQEYFPSQSVIICEEINYNSTLSPDEVVKKYCLDVLPIAKGDTVNYLSKLSDIQQGIVAGDSGNDVEMLLHSGSLNSVLVGGYKPEAEKYIGEALTVKKRGRRSLQKIVQPDGSIKAIYIEQEPGQHQAAESIKRAAEILLRAEKIKIIREKRQSLSKS